ncbi:MAG TPA: hypothetical protein VF515_22690, partial [Candidatus Binatia bacterium]
MDSTRDASTPSPPPKQGLGKVLNAALMVGAVSATLVAVGIVVALFSWLHALPAKDAQEVSSRNVPQHALPVPAAPAAAQPAAQPAAPRAAPVAAVAPRGPAVARADRPVQPAPTPPTQAEPVGTPPVIQQEMHNPERDVGLNRGVARALS